MRVDVDRSTCDLLGQCVLTDPDHFRFTDDDELDYDEAPAEEFRSQVVLAVRSCPVKAITLTED